MNSRDSAFTYQQASAVSATPVGQVVALYDVILRDLRQAMAAVDAGQIEKRVHLTNHALLIIGELQGVLDFERGGEAARNLNNFYTVMRPLVTEASMTASRGKFQALIEKFARLRAAWSKAERTLVPNAPNVVPALMPNVAPSVQEHRPRVSSGAPPAFSQSAPRTSPSAPLPSENSEDSGRSRWSA
jgi:flagellar secretion chaperone FliS